MADSGFIELSSTGLPSIRFEGGSGEPPCLLVAQNGVEGWYGTPDLGVDTTARGSGDGLHDVAVDDIRYGARTVIIHVYAWGRDRSETLRLWDGVRRMCSHRLVTVRVCDASSDMTCRGMASVVKDDGTWERDWIAGTINVVCPRPELLSYRPHRFQLLASHAADGATGVGLSYNQPGYITYWQGTPNASPSVMEIGTNRGSFGLAYPLSYSGSSDMGNVASQSAGLLRNDGSSRAYPVFTCNGPFPNGVALDFPSLNASIECTQPVYDVPLVLDCRARSATVGGLDVSRRLSRRGFPVVEPGGTLVVVLRTGGTGWVDCSIHDTYM